MNIGYAMIRDPVDPIEDQIDVLKSFGCDPIYRDFLHPTSNEKFVIGKLLLEVEPGSMIYCLNFETIFISLDSFIKITNVLKEKNCSMTFIEDEFELNPDNIKFYQGLWDELMDFRAKSKSRRTIKGMRNSFNK